MRTLIGMGAPLRKGWSKAPMAIESIKTGRVVDLAAAPYAAAMALPA